MGWHAPGTALCLWDTGILTDAEYQEIMSLWAEGHRYGDPASTRLREILESKGYDGIVYPNSFEGDGNSYIAFHDEQIIRSEITNFGQGLTTQPPSGPADIGPATPRTPAQQTVDTAQNTDYDNKNNTGGMFYGAGKEALPTNPGGDGEVATGGRQTRQGADGFRSAIPGREEAATPITVRPAVAEGSLTTSQERYTEEDFSTPEPGSPLEQAQQTTLKEHDVTSRVIKLSSWKERGPAAAHGGIIYFCETIAEEELPEAIAHELLHVMKQFGYRPYLDIIQVTPDRIDLQNPASHALLKDVADHRNIDYFSMDDFQLRTLYDELNAAVYGAYKSGQLEIAENRAMLEGGQFECCFCLPQLLLDISVSGYS